MGFGIKLEVWGDYAAFNRPEMKVERVSYDVMTPSAARGILEAIYWKPEMRWIIDEIRVLRPIRFTQVRRNEIASKIPFKGESGVASAARAERGALGLDIQRDRQQRAALILKDVRYGISAHIEVLEAGERTNPIAKHLEMFKRRASKGQYFHRPYLGVREFPAEFELVREFGDCPDELRAEKDLGWMLHDIAFHEDAEGSVVESNRGRRLRAEPHFFRAIMGEGIIRVPNFNPTRG